MEDTSERTYATDKSESLKIIQEAGFNPIGITTMMCEETFIFNTEEEASKAFEYFETNRRANIDKHEYLPDGWWYGLVDFELYHRKYVWDFYEGVDDDAPKIHWL